MIKVNLSPDYHNLSNICPVLTLICTRASQSSVRDVDPLYTYCFPNTQNFVYFDTHIYLLTDPARRTAGKMFSVMFFYLSVHRERVCVLHRPRRGPPSQTWKDFWNTCPRESWERDSLVFPSHIPSLYRSHFLSIPRRKNRDRVVVIFWQK